MLGVALGFAVLSGLPANCARRLPAARFARRLVHVTGADEIGRVAGTGCHIAGRGRVCGSPRAAG